jgi:hypothetical protein
MVYNSKIKNFRQKKAAGLTESYSNPTTGLDRPSVFQEV